VRQWTRADIGRLVEVLKSSGAKGLSSVQGGTYKRQKKKTVPANARKYAAIESTFDFVFSTFKELVLPLCKIHL
jgi:hypothetical protein